MSFLSADRFVPETSLKNQQLNVEAIQGALKRDNRFSMDGIIGPNLPEARQG